MLAELKSGYNNKLDLWSLGCILFEMITDHSAFSGDYAVLQYTQSKIRHNLSLNSNTEWLLRFFCIHNLLEIDPVLRPSAKTAQNAL